MKSGKLNFVEPSGPLQACNRTDLPFYSMLISFSSICRHKDNISDWRKDLDILCIVPEHSIGGPYDEFIEKKML